MNKISKLLVIYSLNPICGVTMHNFEKEDVSEIEAQDDSVINDTYSYNEVGMKAYMKGYDQKADVKEIEYSEELGMSIIKPPNNMNVKDLWKVL